MALPNGPLEIVFSFDTTGSMSCCLDEVRGRVSDMIQRLQADIPGIRIAIFAHGDYCDKNTSYVTKHVDFTDDVAQLCDFVKTVGSTGGGDADECYELVLYEVRTELSWTPGSQRALVMIGDCNPHPPSYRDNTLKLDWKKETGSLSEMGVRIYAVQCKEYRDSDKFYKGMANLTGGQHMKLNDFKNIFDFLMAVCYREKGAEFMDNYESEVRARGPINKDLDDLFGGLRAGSSSDKDSDVSVPIKPMKATKSVKLTKTDTAIKKPASKLSPPATKKSKLFKEMRKVKLQKSLLKYTDKNLPLLRRENVFENNFLLKDMGWSNWQLAISPCATDRTDKARTGSGCGFRARHIFGGKTNVPALYEVGVQTHNRCRKFVVFSKCCARGFSSEGNWERKLLGRSSLKKQIDNVVGKNCSVSVRRVVLNKKQSQDSVRHSLRRYDYAWRGLRSVRPSHRPVTKLGVKISTEMEVDA